MPRTPVVLALSVAVSVAAALSAPVSTAARAAPEPAVPGEWSRHAPVGLFETQLSVSPTDPDLVYAALGEGIARSEDGGLTWEHLGVDEGFGASFSIDTQVEVDPTSDSRVYAATYTGVRRSTDDGGSFPLVGTTTPNTGLDSIVRAVGVDAGAGPADTRVLATGYVQQVALSTDSGSTWTRKTGNAAAVGLGFGDATVLLHPTDTDLAFVASDGVILRTVNLTANPPTWTAIDTATVTGSVLDLALGGNRLLAATTTGQVFRSADALVKTTPAPVWSTAGIDTTGVAADLFPVGSAVFLSTGEGVFKTADVAVSTPSWSEIGGGLPGSNSEAIAGTQDGSTLYAQAGTSIYRSENGGLSWTERGGPVQRTVRDLASGGGRTFATSETGLLRSLDGGLTWAVVPSTAGDEVLAVAVAPSAPGRVLARIDGDVRLSTDGGLTFAPVVPTAPDDVVALAVDPADADVAWAVGGFEAVFRTDDGGATWDQVPDTLLPSSFRAEDIEIAPAVGATPSAVFLAGEEGFVLASVDDGASWVQQSTGLPGGSNDVGDVAVDPADPRHLVAAVDLDGSLYESTNSGGTWSVVLGTDEEENPAALDAVQIDAVTFSPVDGSILIATGWGNDESGRVYQSTDGGASFPPIDPPMDQVYNDAFEILADDQGVYVATQRSGVLDLVLVSDVRAQVTAPAAVAAGAPLVVTVRATSTGPHPASGITVRIPRPAGVTLRSATVTGGTCTLGTTVVCRPGALPATVRLTGAATTAGRKTFRATVDARQVDTNAGNDRAARTVTVRRAVTRLALRATPTVDTTAPHSFVLTGTLARTDRRALACTGQVTALVKNGARTVATKRATLTRAGTTCRYRTTFTLRRAPARTLTVTATHPGSAALAASRSARVTVRLR